MRLLVDHVTGARRGERQLLSIAGRVRFGRHPDCEVAFDPGRDLDASTRHAELRLTDEGAWVLFDLGSSNGTFVDGRRVTEVRLDVDEARWLEFGAGGPSVRVTLGDEGLEAIPPPQPRAKWLGALPWVVAAVAALAGVIAWLAT